MPVNPSSTESQFATAIGLGIPPFNWIPPESPPFAKTASQQGPYEQTIEELASACAILEKGGFEQHANSDHIKQTADDLPRIPHPDSRFEHVDPPPVNEAALRQLPLPEAESYRRLKLAFEWMVCQISSHLADLNRAVLNYSPGDTASLANYQTIRGQYTDFLRNLNNHHPEGDEVNPAKALGFGRNLHWTFVDPVIDLDPMTNRYVILGVTIVAEWNPHVSSSGIPVAHTK